MSALTNGSATGGTALQPPSQLDQSEQGSPWVHAALQSIGFLPQTQTLPTGSVDSTGASQPISSLMQQLQKGGSK